MTGDTSAADPFLWLEEVDGARALAWARAETRRTLELLQDGSFEAERELIHRLLTVPDRIPFVSARGPWLYNFWTDAEHERGLWRRTSLESFRSESPAWEVVLDIDALGRAEGETWVWRGCHALPHEFRRGLVYLSRGGADAVVVREFDLVDRRFLDDGFVLPEAKTNASWLDADTLLLSTNLAPASRTMSGYPRQVRRWRRGEPFERSEVLFEGRETDMGVWCGREHDKGHERSYVSRAIDFFNRELHVDLGRGLVRLDVPLDAEAQVDRDWLTLKLRTDWKPAGETFPAGSVIVVGLGAYLDGARDFSVLFRPGPRTSCEGMVATRSHVVLDVLDNVRSRIDIATPGAGGWQVRTLDGLPDNVALSMMSYEAEGLSGSDRFFAIASGFLTPTSLYLCDGLSAPQLVKQAPAQFDAGGLAVTQHEAVSSDGERIPYFQVARADLPLDGSTPTMLEGYGGFGLSMRPSYRAVTGRLWLERGGALAVANLRGGGEFGPRWHEAGRLAGKRQSHDDFAAVARDLVRRGVTAPKRLAALGGSNGGLLVGNMLTRFPELFGAIVCAVPLLDMRRYTRLPPGASWIAEYGDPDKPADWAFLQTFSAYQMLSAGKPYPPILLATSTRDDRVHPGHARKMAARMQALGYQPLYYENEEGGHGGAADNLQLAFRQALNYAFFRRVLASGGSA